MSFVDRTGRVLLVPLLLCLAGCSGESQPKGVVTGTVTYEGTPVKAGVVNFENSAAGQAAQATIVDGRFQVEVPIPPGIYEVSVTPPPSPPPTPGESTPPPDPADIPAKYRTLGTSDLTAEISEGTNELKFELTP